MRNLDGVKDQFDAMVKAGRARQAVELYETFLAGCYGKADEIDDSGGNLGDFFQGLFVSWIHARQRTGCPAEDTVRCVVRWIEQCQGGEHLILGMGFVAVDYLIVGGDGLVPLLAPGMAVLI